MVMVEKLLLQWAVVVELQICKCKNAN